MALNSYSSRTVPDFNYEFHMVTISSMNQASANTFTVYLNTPLEQVVQARLMGAHIHSKESEEHIFVKCKQLDTKFNDFATEIPPQDYASDPNPSRQRVRGSFATILSNHTSHGSGNTVFVFEDNYPMVVQYIHPLEKVDRLDIELLNPDGDTIVNGANGRENHLIIRFTCRKPNIPGVPTVPWFV